MKAYRFWNKTLYYVEEVKPSLYISGIKGDWAYTSDYRKACELSLNEVNAFLSDHPDAYTCGAPKL